MTPEQRNRLVDARALLAAGWASGISFQRRESGDCYCLTAALGVAAGAMVLRAGRVGFRPSGERFEEFLELVELLGFESDDSTREHTRVVAAFVWNDAEGRTQAEVLERVDRALEAAA